MLMALFLMSRLDGVSERNMFLYLVSDTAAKRHRLENDCIAVFWLKGDGVHVLAKWRKAARNASTFSIAPAFQRLGQRVEHPTQGT
jgi:hypothetical protein